MSTWKVVSVVQATGKLSKLWEKGTLHLRVFVCLFFHALKKKKKDFSKSSF